MSKKRAALIFGHNEYALEVAKNIKYEYENISIFKSKSDETLTSDKNYDIREFDFSNQWDELEEIFDMENSIVFSMLEDDAENIFLTISLRSVFANLSIFALSKSKESAAKLTMAGATKVIPVVQTTANIITDMLRKPIITEVLHNILYEKSELKVVEVTLHDCTPFEGKHPADINWSGKYGVSVLFIILEDNSREFIYSSQAKHHKITSGDVLIMVGYEADIKEFEKLIGGEVCL